MNSTVPICRISINKLLRKQKHYMKKLNMILLCLFTIGFFTQKSNGQELQLFGPGVHQDLDHLISTRSICVPNPTKDYEYNFQKSFETNVNEAIKRERTAFKNSKIGDYVHPQYYTDPVDYAHKIIVALRKAYAAAYDIKVVDVPLDISVTNAAQNHSCKMISCNQFTHQSSCTGSPKSRLSDQVGDWGSCLMGYSENIAINTSSSVEAAIEWAIFGMMYDDLACCRNGHRENFLKCTYDNAWRMGFGFQKGKYSFGSNRSYDAWFMTWDFAKKGSGSNCSWDKDSGAKACPAPSVVSIQNVKVQGRNGCNALSVSWSATNTAQVSSFEVYQSIDNKSFTRVANLPASAKSADFSSEGKEARIFVKALTKSGSFFSSRLVGFDLDDCAENTNEAPEEDDETIVDVTDDVPDPQPQPQPQPEPEPDPDQIGISPNPANTYIRLNGAPVGSIYWIYNMDGRIALLGVYRGGIIQVSRLKAGTYVIRVGDKTGQFVKL